MRANLRWIEDYVRVDVPLKKLIELLDNSGSKVEAVHRTTAEVNGVVVAEVLDVRPHPNADNLTLVDVTTGDEKTERVVCGAQNFTVGDRVPFATVGARLGDMGISERKIRGEASRGMLCSAAELTISRDHSGIFVLPKDAPLGEDVIEVMDLDVPVLELEITPNRGDCMGMIGIAREVAALLGNELQIPEAGLDVDGSLHAPMKVEVEDPRGCPRYHARYISEIEVGPSPLLIAKRLMSMGIRPISNVVDATNYVMVETGQPLHAFDAGKVREQHIIVRRARHGERLTTLDGVDRELHPDDLLICDASGPIGFAGVIGGEDSEVSPDTTTVILESASFDPASIALTAQRHLVRTEASARFERGTDIAGVTFAAARACKLIAESAGARVAERNVDVYPAPVEPWTINLRPQRTVAIVGVNLGAETQAKHLNSIGMKATTADDGTLSVVVPTWRRDVTREIDLVEEVARLAGFDRITATIPPGRTGELTPQQDAERRLKTTLAGLGVFEAWTPSWMSSKVFDALQLPPDHAARRLVRLANPMTEDEEGMRTTLLPSLLKSVAHNVARRTDSVALFEVARVYEPTNDTLPQEALVLAAAFTGERIPKGWKVDPQAWDYFAAKGVLEAAVRSLRAGVSFESISGTPWHLTRAARVNIDGKEAGALGEIHPDVCEAFDVPEGTVGFEVALAPLFVHAGERATVSELGKFPSTYLDLAVVVAEDFPAGRVEELIRSLGAPELDSVRLFDLYVGDQIESEHKSLAYALELRVPDRTLTDEEALSVRERIVAGLAAQAGARLRT